MMIIMMIMNDNNDNDNEIYDNNEMIMINDVIMKIMNNNDMKL